MTDCLCLPNGKDGVIRLASLAIWKMTRMQQSHIIGHNASQNKQKILPEYWFTIQHTREKNKIKFLIKIYVITSTAKVSIPVIYTEIFKIFPCHQIIDLLKYKQNPWPWLNHMCSAVNFHNICPIIQLPRIHQTCIRPKKGKKMFVILHL